MKKIRFNSDDTIHTYTLDKRVNRVENRREQERINRNLSIIEDYTDNENGAIDVKMNLRKCTIISICEQICKIPFRIVDRKATYKYVRNLE
jgi:hypothetical protein